MAAGPLQVERIGDVAVVRFTGASIIDETAAEVVGQELFDLVESDGQRQMLLNLSNVEFLTSTALGKLVMLHKKLRDRGGEMRICGLQSQIRDIFVITRLDTLFELYDDEAGGLAAFA